MISFEFFVPHRWSLGCYRSFPEKYISRHYFKKIQDYSARTSYTGETVYLFRPPIWISKFFGRSVMLDLYFRRFKRTTNGLPRINNTLHSDILRLSTSCLSSMPLLHSDNPLAPWLAVLRPPLITKFQTFVTKLRLDELAYILMRWDRVVYNKTSNMTVTTLVEDR